MSSRLSHASNGDRLGLPNLCHDSGVYITIGCSNKQSPKGTVIENLVGILAVKQEFVLSSSYDMSIKVD